MNYASPWPTEDRYQRRVRRMQLRVHPHAPARRLAFSAEEALRLTSLPGENEGRVYFFRQVRVAGLSADGDRRAWLESFERALRQQAAESVHADDPRATTASAVFFRSEQEALEILLHRVLAGRAIREWFWPMVMPDAATASPASGAHLVCGIVEKLRARSASWLAVAMAVFSAPEQDVVRLLGAVPPAAAENWLREIQPSHAPGNYFAAKIPSGAQPSIHHAVRAFGIDSARTLWLTALAVLIESPAELSVGTAVTRAQETLRALVPEELPLPPASSHATLQEPHAPESVSPIQSEPQSPSDSAIPWPTASTGAAPPASDGNELAPPPSQISQEVICSREAEHADRNLLANPAPFAPTAASNAEPPPPSHAADLNPLAHLSDDSSQSYFSSHDGHWRCEGLPTQLAGLFFLLNVLERLGFAEALQAGLSPAAPKLVALLLLRLAATANVAADDPIVLWLNCLLADLASDDDLIHCDSSCWPADFQSPREVASLEYIVRLWSVAVRRWCWRVAGIAVTDIVVRRGVFSVNRTDLDVSLPLHAAEVRVRRAGLDLDPGWLPWFGRVVRFHYFESGELHVAE